MWQASCSLCLVKYAPIRTRRHLDYTVSEALRCQPPSTCDMIVPPPYISMSLPLELRGNTFSSSRQLGGSLAAGCLSEGKARDSTGGTSHRGEHTKHAMKPDSNNLYQEPESWAWNWAECRGLSSVTGAIPCKALCRLTSANAEMAATPERRHPLEG